MAQESVLLARAFGRLDGALAAFGNADELGPMLRRAEVVASSRIDGNQASLIDLLDAEAGLTVTGPSRDVAELRALSDLAGSAAHRTSARWLVTQSPRRTGQEAGASGGRLAQCPAVDWTFWIHTR